MWKKQFQRLVDEYDDTFQGKKIDHNNIFYDHPDDRLVIKQATKDYYKNEMGGAMKGLKTLIFGNQIPGSEYHIYAKKHNITCLQKQKDYSHKFQLAHFLPFLSTTEQEDKTDYKFQNDLEVILYCSIRSLQLMHNVFPGKLKEYEDEIEICQATHPQKSDLFQFVKCTDKAKATAREQYHSIIKSYVSEQISLDNNEEQNSQQ